MRSIMGQDLSSYVRRLQPRGVGVCGVLTDRRQIAAGVATPFELKIDSRAPFFLTRLAITLDELPHPVDVAVLIFLERAEADLLHESGAWNRDLIVRNRPHLYATPLGSGGLFGGRDFPIGQIVRPSSIIEMVFDETGGVAYNGTLVAHGFYLEKEPSFKRVGDIQLLEPDHEGELPEPAGRCYMIGDQVAIAAGQSGDLVFNLRTSEIAYADLILTSMDSLPLWGAGLAAMPLNVSQVSVQLEGEHEGYKIMSGVPANIAAIFGGTGAVGSRMFDRSMRLEPGSDVIVTLNNTDVANPHTVYGCLVVHRY